MAIKVGTVVRLSDEFCRCVHADDDTANMLGIVREIVTRYEPARAKVHWDTGFTCGWYVCNLEEYKGVVPTATKEEWGLA